MTHEIMRVSAKGQLTIPVTIRKKLNIREGDYVHVQLEKDEVRIKKVKPVKPLSNEDPMWKMIGAGTSGYSDISVNHDQHAAEGEAKRWK